jgi:hypothetical protein
MWHQTLFNFAFLAPLLRSLGYHDSNCTDSVNCASEEMRLPSLIFNGLVPSVLATNLYVSSYAGNITSLALSALPNGGYSLTASSVINAPLSDKPSWLTKDDEKNVLYGVDEAWDVPNGTVATFKTSPSGKLSVIDSKLTVGGAVSAVTYNKGKALVVAH